MVTSHLCTSVEPVGKEAMCERAVNHPMPHRAVIETIDGTMTCEWLDAWRIREKVKDGLRKAR